VRRGPSHHRSLGSAEFGLLRLSALAINSDQPYVQRRRNSEQGHYFGIAGGPFQMLDRVCMDSSRVPQLLLAQFPLSAAVPNLISKVFKEGTWAHAARFDP
jgi:hypothetical protein